MSTDFDKDDLARMFALEHAFYALALISAGNFSYLSDISITSAVKAFRNPIEGSILDDRNIPKEIRPLVQGHLMRMFDHVSRMAEMAESGHRE